jgi:hypothetical protein
LRQLVGLPLSSDPAARKQYGSSAPAPAAPQSESQPPPPALTFRGYVCTVDCSGHEAGYDWAQEHDITDRDDCPIDPNNSHSFTEGCWAYADEQTGDSGDSNDADDTPP